jgi:hypothetical protein
MVARKLYRIACAFALFVKAHRIALFLHRIRIAHFAFSPFSLLLGRYFTVNAPKSCEMCETNAQNMKKRKKKKKKKTAKMQKMRRSAECECDANMESKFASHRTTVTNFFRIFSHRILIALPSLS